MVTVLLVITRASSGTGRYSVSLIALYSSIRLLSMVNETLMSPAAFLLHFAGIWKSRLANDPTGVWTMVAVVELSAVKTRLLGSPGKSYSSSSSQEVNPTEHKASAPAIMKIFFRFFMSIQLLVDCRILNLDATAEVVVGLDVGLGNVVITVDEERSKSALSA